MKTIDYTALSEELNEVLAKLQSNDVSIDEAVALYARGITISKSLEKYLQEAENKITKIQAETA